MKNKWKIVMIFFLIAAVFFLEPVSYVLADNGEGVYNTEIPYLQGLKVELERNDGWKVFDGILTGLIDRQRSIGFVNFEFNKLSSVDYSLYELVYDYELKSLLDDGTIVLHEYQNITEIDKDSSPGFLNNLLISLSIKDDYFVQRFSYLGLIKQSPYFQEKLSQEGMVFVKGLNSYNTVISKVECYLREKSTGNYGLVSRFIFTWDSNFWLQKCNGITYELFASDTGEIIQTDGITDPLFAGSFSSDGDDSIFSKIPILGDIREFLFDVPSALVALVLGFVEVVEHIGGLFQAVFPFIPPVLFKVFGIFIFLTFIIAAYKMVFGD